MKAQKIKELNIKARFVENNGKLLKIDRRSWWLSSEIIRDLLNGIDLGKVLKPIKWNDL